MDLTNLHPGSVVDGFRVCEKVHEGGMAVLYRVERDGDAMPMLMKVPRLEFGSHPSCYIGFEVEQMIMETLSGPYVPRWVTKGTHEDTPYIVMEYVEGRSLHEWAEVTPLSPAEAARLVAALATAVHDLHRQEVIHLDIKPSNVIIRPGGDAVLLDFGLAHHGHFPDLVEEEFHKAVGTPAYISPEQVQGNRNDPRSDIYAIGVILYQLCTGYLPFGSPASLSGFRRRLFLDPIPPRCHVADLPHWMQEIILHCLEVEVEKRYASASQLAFDLIHPDHVTLTERSLRMKRAGPVKVFSRWWHSVGVQAEDNMVPTRHLAQAPQILVALDIAASREALLNGMQSVVQRTAVTNENSRIVCVTVLEPDLSTDQDSGQEIANSLFTQRLVELHHWAAALELPANRLRFHVLQGTNAATTLLAYASQHQMDHIVIGARGHSALRRLLGSVSARVAAEAHCTVTVVRQ